MPLPDRGGRPPEVGVPRATRWWMRSVLPRTGADGTRWQHRPPGRVWDPIPPVDSAPRRRQCEGREVPHGPHDPPFCVDNLIPTKRSTLDEPGPARRAHPAPQQRPTARDRLRQRLEALAALAELDTAPEVRR